MTDKLFQIKELHINEIIVKDRARKDIGDLTKLKESIQESGQLNPILINSNNELIAGERRLRACKELGHKTIITRIMPHVDKDELLIIELMENEARKDFVWHEELELRYKLHKYWKEQANGRGKSWGFRETAKRLNCSLGGLSSDLTLAENLMIFPDLKKFDKKNQARDAYKKLAQQAESIQAMDNLSDEEKARMEDLMSGKKISQLAEKTPTIKAKHADTIPSLNDNQVGSQDEQPQEDITQDSVPDVVYAVEKLETFLTKIPNNTVGFIELDPPYAIDFAENYGKIGKIKVKATDWTTDQLFKFYNEQLPILYNKLLDNSWILCWTGKEHWKETNIIAKACGFGVQMPGIWAKPGGSTNTPKTTLVSNYEMFLLFRKGQATFNIPSVPSVINYDPPPASQRIHQWEKPIEMYKYFLTACGKPKSIFLSPFAGSGNSLIAAAMFDMIPMGCDSNQKYVYSFYDRLNSYFMGE